MEMDSLLDPVIDSSHRSYFAAVEHRALEVLRPRPPGEAISIHHDWYDRYVMKYYCLSLMYEPCTIPYCNCPCHKKKSPAPPAPPPAPPAMGGYCGEGSTQFATWGYGY